MQEQVEMIKNSQNNLSLLKSIMQDMERDLELNQNFFFNDNVDHKRNIILRRCLKSITTRITAQQKLNREIF